MSNSENLPETPITPAPEHHNRSPRARHNQIGGVILIVLGVILLIQNIIDYNFLAKFWPLLLIGFGAILLVKNR